MKESTNTQARREKVHRNREIAIAAVLVLFVFIGTWGQTTYFGSDSWYFLVLLNLNAILMLVVCFLAVRNIVKLFTERRRKVFGSRLRTRLLLAFVSLSLVPVFLMFLAANRVVITSIDYWFTSTVASSMDAAIQVGQNIYDTASSKLANRIELISHEIENNQDSEITPKDVEEYLLKQTLLLDSNIFALVDKSNSFSRLAFALPEKRSTSVLIQNIFQNTQWSSIGKNPFTSLYSSAGNDYAVAIKELDSLPSYLLVIAENIGSVAQSNLESISQGFEEYIYLKSLKRPLKLSFSLILGLLALIMVFSAIFMAVRLSKELTAPIALLAKGTDRIAQGELDVFLEDKGKDELGQLVASFNSMTKHVRETNENISKANKELEQRNIFIETVLENIATGVVVLSRDGQVLTINKAACTILDMPEEIFTQLTPTEYFTPKNQKIFENMLIYLTDNPDKVWRKELEAVIRNQHVKLLFNSLLIPNFNHAQEENLENDLIIAVIEDITELTLAERLGAWREVAKRIAHEMKNPLTPIRLSAERLERKFNPQHAETAFTDCTTLIISEVERMQKMIKNFTEFSRMPEIQLKKENLANILQESYQIFKSSHTHIDWQINLPDSIPPLLLHTESFKQALVNIYLNACEILEQTVHPKVITSVEIAQNFCLLTIADNGIQLSKDDLGHMFEPYYSNKKDGTGLGLAIVQETISTHNATIYAENNQYGGTSIHIKIPLIQI